jgi:hypothetical protein
MYGHNMRQGTNGSWKTMGDTYLLWSSSSPPNTDSTHIYNHFHLNHICYILYMIDPTPCLPLPLILIENTLMTLA